MDCAVVDLLPDEIWDAILNGTGAHKTPILDPRWRPWAALVCRRWYRLVRGASTRAIALRSRAPAQSPRHDHAAWASARVLCASTVADILVGSASRNGVDSASCYDTIVEVTRTSLSAHEASPVMVSLALEGSGVPAVLGYARATFDERCLIDIEDAVYDDGDGKKNVISKLSEWIESNDRGNHISSPLDRVRESENALADASARVLDALRALVALRRRHPDALDRYDREKALSLAFDRYAYEAAIGGDLDLLGRVFDLGGSTRSGGSCPETIRLPGVSYDDGDGHGGGNEDHPDATATGNIVPYHLLNGTRYRSVRSQFARGETVESYWVLHAVDGAINGGRADVMDFIIERAGWICVMWAAPRAIRADCAALFCVADARGLTYDARDILRSAIRDGGPRVCAHMAAALQRVHGRLDPPLAALIKFPSSSTIWDWAREMGFAPDAHWFSVIVRECNVDVVGPWRAAAFYNMEPRSMARLAVVWPAEAIEHAGALVVASAALSTRNECSGLGALLAALERTQCDVDLWAIAVDDVRVSANGPSAGRLFFALHWLARMAHYCDPVRVPVAPHTNRIDEMLGIKYRRSQMSDHFDDDKAVPWHRFCRPRVLDGALVSCVHAALTRPLDTLLDRVYARRARDVLSHLSDVLS